MVILLTSKDSQPAFLMRVLGCLKVQFDVLCCVLLILIFSVQTASALESDFPFPDSLRPAVNFWVKVYTEVDTESGYLHDSHNLDVIYQSLNRDRKKINSTRNAIKVDLQVLASGKRTGLTNQQSKLLALWPEGVSNARLAKAVKNVRWQLGQSDRFEAGLKRSGAYREFIENVVQTKGLPIELASLPHVESSFHPGAFSSAAATGMWQFVRSTATRFMQVDYVVDERLDPYIATSGAMALLEYNYNELGTWPLALTAYNHGANGMARAVREVGSNDIGKIIAEYKGSRFGFASRNFYSQFLAVQLIESKVDEFFGSVKLDPAPVFVSQKLDSYVAASTVAESLQVSINALKSANPALQPAVWSGLKLIPAGYVVKISEKVFSGDLLTSLDSIKSSQLYSKQMSDLSYTVSRGDSLSTIANRYKTSVSELVAINQLRNRNRIKIGQVLMLPKLNGTMPALLVNANTSRDIPEDGQYKVKRGDSISVIASHFRLNKNSVLAMNNLTSKSVIYPGQKLMLRAPRQLRLVKLSPQEPVQ